MIEKLRARSSDLAAAVVFVFASVGYFEHAIHIAAHAPYWMDEVLAVWTARQPDVHAVWSALERGAEFSPPLFDMMLHALIGAGRSGPLAMRLPSILAVYLAALAVGVLARRHAGWPQAALAATVLLSSGLFAYAIQARPYACQTAAFAWALVVWDRLTATRVKAPLIALLAALLIVLTALHFYSLVLIAILAVAELVGVRIGHASRLPVLAAIAVGAVSLALWAPILHAARTFSGADVSALEYYGKPILLRLAFAYWLLLGWLATPLAGLLAVVLIRRRSSEAPELGRLALLLLSIPVVVFLFALVVSHSFSARYAVAATIGIALLFAWATSQLGQWGDAVALALLATCALIGTGGDLGQAGWIARMDALAVIRSAAPGMPIVTGDGLRFLELYENGSADVKRRLVYLDLGEVASRDPTNRHQVERWKSINPKLPVEAAKPFRCRTPAFLLFVDPKGGTDDVPRWLAGFAAFAKPLPDRASLTLVRPKPCPAS